MKDFVGKVTIHNGRFPRTFEVRAKASVWTYAMKKATQSGLEQFRRLARRERIERVAVELNAVRSERQEVAHGPQPAA